MDNKHLKYKYLKYKTKYIKLLQVGGGYKASTYSITESDYKYSIYKESETKYIYSIESPNKKYKMIIEDTQPLEIKYLEGVKDIESKTYKGCLKSTTKANGKSGENIIKYIDRYGKIYRNEEWGWNNMFNFCSENKGLSAFFNAYGKIFQCHGLGIMKYKNGNLYNGEWEDDLRHGDGKMTFILIDNTTNEYDGKWKKDKINGLGTMEYGNGNVYKGEWKNNKMHGLGTMNLENGDVYTGNWINDIRQGEGTMNLENGDVYTGNWENDEITTTIPVKVTYKNGDIYDGYWKDNTKHGNGKMTYATGDIYDGDWENNELHKGIVTYTNITDLNTMLDIDSNKIQYNGDLKEKTREGNGKLIFYKDDVVICFYNGSWKNNKVDTSKSFTICYNNVFYSNQQLYKVKVLEISNLLELSPETEYALFAGFIGHKKCNVWDFKIKKCTNGEVKKISMSKKTNYEKMFSSGILEYE
jgi:hypothetical protein